MELHFWVLLMSYLSAENPSELWHKSGMVVVQLVKLLLTQLRSSSGGPLSGTTLDSRVMWWFLHY